MVPINRFAKMGLCFVHKVVTLFLACNDVIENSNSRCKTHAQVVYFHNETYSLFTRRALAVPNQVQLTSAITRQR